MSHWCGWQWSWFCSTKYICTWSSFTSFSFFSSTKLFNLRSVSLMSVTLELVLLNKIYLYTVKLYGYWSCSTKYIFVHGQALWSLVLLNKIYLYTVKLYVYTYLLTVENVHKYIFLYSYFSFIDIGCNMYTIHNSSIISSYCITLVWSTSCYTSLYYQIYHYIFHNQHLPLIKCFHMDSL